MKKKLSCLAFAAAAALCATAAHADVFQFNAHLTADQEVPPVASNAHGLATLFYDDHGTANLVDDTFSFSMAVFGLSGPVVAAHIHGAAAPGQNAPPQVHLDMAPFVWSNVGGTLLVGGDAVPAMMVPDTPASPTNPGYPAMSFFDMLNSGLAYVNVHTPTHPSGEVRGQFVAVTAVPEPSTYGLMLAGLGALGWVARKRRSAKP
jgi:hypothetical protein